MSKRRKSVYKVEVNKIIMWNVNLKEKTLFLCELLISIFGYIVSKLKYMSCSGQYRMFTKLNQNYQKQAKNSSTIIL